MFENADVTLTPHQNNIFADFTFIWALTMKSKLSFLALYNLLVVYKSVPSNS